MHKRSGSGKVRLVPQLSSYHSELQKRVAIVGVSLVVILILVGLGLYVAPGKFVGKAVYTLQDGASCSGVPAGLVSWWRGENRADALGNNNIPASSTVNVAAGKVGNAFNVGGGQVIIGPSSSSLQIDGDLTIMWWQKLNGFSSVLDTRSVAVAYGDWTLPDTEVKNYLYKVGVKTVSTDPLAGRYTTFHESGAGMDEERNFQLTVLNSWKHIAVIRDITDKTYTVFIDGVPAASQSYTNNPTGGGSGYLTVGGTVQPAEIFNGLIDEIAVFNTKLTPVEVNTIYQAGQAGNPMCGTAAGGEGGGGGGGSGSEICNDGVDNDNDQFIDCLDTSCYENAACKNQVCSAGKTVAWSYSLPEEGTELAGNLAPERTGCCAANQCAGSSTDPNSCLNVGSYLSGVALCDTDRNWHTCTAAQQNQINLGGKFQCDGTQWQPLCIPANKYKLRNSNTEICDGQLWRSCANIVLTPILNPHIYVACDPNTPPAAITVSEMICNNNIDDDNDGSIDRADSNCQELLSYVLNERRNEVVIKRTDDFRVTISNPPSS